MLAAHDELGCAGQDIAFSNLDCPEQYIYILYGGSMVAMTQHNIIESLSEVSSPANKHCVGILSSATECSM